MRFARVALIALLGGILLGGPSLATTPDARTLIQAAYDKSAQAASLRFLTGALSIRAAGFVATGLSGERLDQREQKAALERLFAMSLNIDESIKLLSFTQKSPTQAECTLTDTLSFTLLDPKTRKENILHLESNSRDEWISTRRGWRLASSSLLQQKSTSNPVTNNDLAPSPTPAASPTEGAASPAESEQVLPGGWSRPRLAAAAVTAASLLALLWFGLSKPRRRRRSGKKRPK